MYYETDCLGALINTCSENIFLSTLWFIIGCVRHLLSANSSSIEIRNIWFHQRLELFFRFLSSECMDECNKCLLWAHFLLDPVCLWPATYWVYFNKQSGCLCLYKHPLCICLWWWVLIIEQKDSWRVAFNAHGHYLHNDLVRK